MQTPNQLYDWQEECLKRWFDHHGRGIVQAVTGSGKTLLALHAMHRMDCRLHGELKVRIVVPTSALMRQWNRSLQDYLASGFETPRIGLRGGGFKASPDSKYLIYVINSARYELARQILAELKRGENVLLIADECHHYISGQNQLIFEFIPYLDQCAGRFFSLGLSATPPSGQALRNLSESLGQVIYRYGIQEAEAGRTVSPYNIYHISLSFFEDERYSYEDLSKRINLLYTRLSKARPSLGLLGHTERFELLQRLTGDKDQRIAEAAALYLNLTYKRKSLVCLASARTSCACDLVELLDKKEKIIIFSERISQAEELYRLFQESCPGQAGRYHSKMGSQANRNVLERFRTGTIRILIACKAIDEGLDVPDASIGIILSGTSTTRQRIQRLGRIIRRKTDIDSACLYYLHISETSEDSCFLPDAGQRFLTELSYDAGTRRFANPAYDAKVSVLLLKLEQAGTDEARIQEARRCFRLGCVRPDWRLSEDEITLRIQNARHTSEKNYWICMKRLGTIQ